MRTLCPTNGVSAATSRGSTPSATSDTTRATSASLTTPSAARSPRPRTATTRPVDPLHAGGQARDVDRPTDSSPNDCPAEPTWDQRILALLPSSVDLGQLRENLRRTPTERVEHMLALVEFIETQGGRARVRSPSHR